MVQLKNLSFSYKGKEPLFSKLQLTLNGGNIYGLLGKNGAGKTTLLKIICGLLFARTGESMVMGSSSRQRSPAFLQELFFIPEEFHVPSISVEAFRKYHGPLYPRFSNSDFESYLREFGVKQSEGLSSLSYGNKKKFLIAFGLATQCSLLLLDEPTNGLDIPTKSQFRKLLAGALTDERIFIISTHQVRDMENLIDPIIIIDNGRIVFHETTQNVSTRLAVSTVEDPANIENVLYIEKTLAGYTVVSPNTNGVESKIDLELLFNTVTRSNRKIEELFTKGGA